MIYHPVQVSAVLKSLSPASQEDLSVLQFLLRCAQWLRQGTSLDLGAVRESSTVALCLPVDKDENVEVRSLMEMIPEEAKRYLHGLVEALEIYQSIHGRALPVQTLSLYDKSVHEIKQIRDMCIEEGLRSIY